MSKKSKDEPLARHGRLEFLKRTYLFLEKYVVLIGAIILILWLIPPIRVLLTDNLSCVSDGKGGRICNPSAVIIAILGIAVSVFWRLFFEFDKRLDTAISVLTKTNNDPILGGVNTVYPKLREIVARYPHRRKTKCTLEVLGLNLFTAWPHIQGYLNDPNFSGWCIYLYCLNPKFIQDNKDTIPEGWAKEAENKINEINKYKSARARDLQERSVSIDLVSYSHFPAIHGFRINNADILLSAIDWGEDNLIADPTAPRHFYRFFAASDQSLEAEVFRGLFENWINRTIKAGTIC